MPCYNPRLAYYSSTPSKNFKYSLQFTPKKSNKELSPISIPCRKCIGCRIDYSLSWATRMECEAKSHLDCSFITLTYSDDHLPKTGSLVKSDFQKFIKRLRKTYPNRNIKYYGVGEYGENTNRPHYHACIFGFNFEKSQWNYHSTNRHTKTKNFTSPSLQKLWTKGHSLVGEFNFKTAAYCARYVTKKIYGEKAPEHYQGRLPEFALMSRKPAIGKIWFTKNYNQTDKLVINGENRIMPRFFKEISKTLNPFYAHNKIDFLTSDLYNKLSTKTRADLLREKTYFLAIASAALQRKKQ